MDRPEDAQLIVSQSSENRTAADAAAVSVNDPHVEEIELQAAGASSSSVRQQQQHYPRQPEQMTPQQLSELREATRLRDAIIADLRAVTLLEQEIRAAESTQRHLISFTCLHGYHDESCRWLLRVNLIITLIVTILSVLSKTEEAALISLFVYLPVLAAAWAQLHAAKVIGSISYIRPLQFCAIASIILSGTSLGIRIYAWHTDRHHGLHVIDWVLLALQICELIIAFVIFVGADQIGLAIGQISVLIAKAESASLVSSPAHQTRRDSLRNRPLWRRVINLFFTALWYCVSTPFRQRSHRKTE